MSNESKKIARPELAICRIDERCSNQSCFAKGSGVAIRLDEATAARFGCDEICIASVDSVVSKETLETKSLTAHFRDKQGSGCVSFDLTASSSNCSLLSESVSRCEVPDFELSFSNPNIVLIPTGTDHVRYCGKLRHLHKMGFRNSLQKHRPLPIHVAVHRSADNDVPEQGSSSTLDDGFLRMDESLLCYVMVDHGNQPCPSVIWRSYELFRDAERAFYLQKPRDRASARIVMRTDFVGDEAPRGAVILNHDGEFVGLLVFLDNGRLHPVFLHNCNLVTSSQGELKNGGTCKDLTADREHINGNLNADCSFGCRKSLSIACGNKMLLGSDDHEKKMNQQLPELATTDSGSTEFRQATGDTSSQANCSQHVAGEEHDSRNESKEPAALSNPGSRISEEDVQHSTGNRVKNADLLSLPGEGADNRDRLSVSRSSSMSSGKIDRESADSDYGTETASRADEDGAGLAYCSPGNNVQHPMEVSGSFDNGMAAVGRAVDSIQGQFGGIVEQEGRNTDWTNNNTTESVSPEASDIEGSDGRVEGDRTCYDNNPLFQVPRSPAMSSRRWTEPHVSRKPTAERCYSVLSTIQINSDSLVANVIMLNINILDELARYLDKPGFVSCWKQLASYFSIPEDVYQRVNQSGNTRPSKEMFQWFRCTRPELTIREIKEALKKIGRQNLVDVINTKLEDDCVVEDLIDDDVFERICLELDTADINGWELFGKKLDVSNDDLAKFGSHCHAAEQVFKYIAAAKPDTTANDLKQKLKKLNRKDVCKSLDKVPGDCKIGILMSRHMNTMENVFAQLNKMSSNTNNWRHLTQEYGMSESQLFGLEPSCDQSPTKLILDYLTKKNPEMTLKDLLHALMSINRNDAINALKKYLNAESVDQLLKEIEEEIKRGQRYRPCNTT